jgi:glutaredoxin
MEVEIYTVRNCAKCKEVKKYLEEKGVGFKELDMSIGGIPELQQKKKEFKSMGLTTYPVTLIKDEGGVIPLESFNKEEFDKVFGG